MNAQVNQLNDSTIKTVWKLVYWILALFFLGFGFIAVIGGSEWWGVSFIINGFLFITSSTSLNGKGKKILDKEIIYLMLVLFSSFLGILLVLGFNLWWGVISFVIMTILSFFSVTLNEENKKPPIIEKFYKKINSLLSVKANTLFDSSKSNTFSSELQETNFKVVDGHTDNKSAKNQNSASIVDIISRNPLISTIIGGLIVSIIMLIIEKIL